MERFASYSWPGNVRELENIVKRIIVLGTENVELSGCSESGSVVEKTVHKLVENNEMEAEEAREVEEAVEIVETTYQPRRLKEIAREAVSMAEKEAISKALLFCKWNKRKTAEVLSISYKTLFYKMRQYNLLE